MDHLHHFGLSEDPFRNDHVERFYVSTPSQAEALRRLDRGVRQGRGLIVLVGGVGAGKTVVARKLYEELEEEVFESSMMVVLRGQADADWLLERFASQLGVEERAAGREAQVAQIYERLAIIREDGRHAVLVIDDAHGLAAHETLTELCGLVKLEYEDRRLLSVVLAGAPPLERAIASDPLLAHHVEVKVSLAALDREAVAAYLGHRLELAGADPRIVLPGAVAGLHELSGGWPGLLNTLADNALFEAFLAGRSQLTRSDVERAHADLGWGELGTGPARKAAAERLDPEATFSARPGRGLAETTSPDAGSGPLGDLDSELEAVFEPGTPARRAPSRAEPTVVMDFDAPKRGKRPVPSGAAAAATEIQLEPADQLSGPPKGDEVDDLFMELLDD